MRTFDETLIRYGVSNKNINTNFTVYKGFAIKND